MRTKKKSSGKIPEKKSAVPYKSAAPHRHKPSRPLQTVKLPKSQMPSRQTEEHQALLRTKYHKKRQKLKHIFRKKSLLPLFKKQTAKASMTFSVIEAFAM